METNFDVTLKYIDHLFKFVKVSTFSKTVYEGWLKDIDPLSGNLILINFQTAATDNDSVTLVQGHNCKSVEVVSENISMKNSIQYFFDEETLERLKHPSKEDIDRKERLISWFKRNRLEIEESDNSIVVCNSVTIHPPYTIEDCNSNNGRVLVMTKNLISSMPEANENVADIKSEVKKD